MKTIKIIIHIIFIYMLHTSNYTILFPSFLCLSIKLLVTCQKRGTFARTNIILLSFQPSKTIEKLRINCYFDLRNKLFFLTVNRKYSIDSFIPLRKKKKKTKANKGENWKSRTTKKQNEKEKKFKGTKLSACKRGLVERITREKSYIYHF